MALIPSFPIMEMKCFLKGSECIINIHEQNERTAKKISTEHIFIYSEVAIEETLLDQSRSWDVSVAELQNL